MFRNPGEEKMKYKFMHKDDICGILSLVGQTGDYEALKITNPELMPYLGHADDSKMRIWWKTRAVPIPGFQSWKGK